MRQTGTTISAVSKWSSYSLQEVKLSFVVPWLHFCFHLSGTEGIGIEATYFHNVAASWRHSKSATETTYDLLISVAEENATCAHGRCNIAPEHVPMREIQGEMLAYYPYCVAIESALACCIPYVHEGPREIAHVRFRLIFYAMCFLGCFSFSVRHVSQKV